LLLFRCGILRARQGAAIRAAGEQHLRINQMVESVYTNEINEEIDMSYFVSGTDISDQ
jgi:hypothetical protein